MKTKPIKAWCVFDNNGKMLLGTVSKFRKSSIANYARGRTVPDTASFWRHSKTKGYTCRQVEILENSNGE